MELYGQASDFISLPNSLPREMKTNVYAQKPTATSSIKTRRGKQPMYIMDKQSVVNIYSRITIPP